MNEAIIIFTRVPIKGKTKTRLEGFLTKEGCRDIHISFLKDIKETCKKIKRDIFIFYTPEGNKNILEDILGDLGEYYVQLGKDLGEKMFNAISCILDKGYNSCILIGTDIPEIKKSHLESAFKSLEKSDVVIGPTVDKGYYLIGMKNSNKAIFENQTYGKGNVFSNTVGKIRKQNLTYSIMETCLDIDEEEDIYLLYKKIKDKKVNCKYTARFLESIMEVETCID